MKKSVLLSGYYGFRNFGDDIFCQVAAWGANKFWQRQARFMVPELPVFPAELNIHKPGPIRSKLAARGYEYFESVCTNLKVYSGGSIFSRKPDRFYELRNLDRFLSMFGKELGAIGVSIGPFASQSDYCWIESFLTKFSFLSTRDKNSYDLLENMHLPGKIVRGFDLAVLYPFLFDQVDKKTANRNHKRIVISVCHYERYVGKDTRVEKEREEQFLQALELLLSKRSDVNLKFISLNGSPKYGDHEITLSFIQHLHKYGDRIELQEYEKDTRDIFNSISDCDLLVGIRLHSGIMAYTAGVPFILCEYHPKCTAFLDDINYPISHRCGNPNIEPDLLVNSINKILDQDQASFYRDIVPLKNTQEQAMRNFTEAPWLRDHPDEI